MIHFNETSELTTTFLKTFVSSYILSFPWHSSKWKVKEFRNFNGFDVCINSSSMRKFKLNGTKCAICGLDGDLAILFQENLAFRFHIFGLEDEKLVQMTTDHIIPKSKGGKSLLSNLQTLCMPCNLTKADKVNLELTDEFFIKRKTAQKTKKSLEINSLHIW